MKNKFFIGLGVVVVLLGVLFVNQFVYPFSAADPNFADVERVFNKMQFPTDWQQIDQSENRGIAGRRCPIESESRCFHKSKTFKIPDNSTPEELKNLLLKTGCSAVAITDNSYKGDLKESKNLECSIEGLNIDGAYRGPKSEVYVSVGT